MVLILLITYFSRPEDIENTRSRLGCSINTPSALSDIELESNTNNPNPDVFRFFDVIVSGIVGRD